MDLITRTDAQALIPEDSVNEIIKVAEETSVIMRLGRRVRDMSRKQTRVPVLETLPEAYFIDADDGRIPTSNQAWANKYFTAEKIGAIIPISNDVLEDADFDIFGEVRPAIGAAIARAFDRAVLFGIGAPASWPDDVLTAATAASHAVSLATVQGNSGDIYDAILGEGGVASLVEEDGFAVTGYIGAPGTKSKLRALRGQDGQPVFASSVQDATRYALDGQPVAFTANGVMDTSQALLFAGAFDQLLWTVRRDMTWKLLDQGTVEDLAGNTVYNLGTQDMVALRVTMRLAWQVPNPVTAENDNAATRYPFAVLTP